MRPLKYSRPGALLVSALTILLASFAVTHAQRGAGPVETRSVLPLATNTLTANPDAYYGELVNLTAAVDQVMSGTTFSIVQRSVGEGGKGTKNFGKEVLILTPTLYGAVALNSYVTVVGEVVRFEPAEIAAKAKALKLDLAPDVVEKYRGRPAVIATSVLTVNMVDLTRVPPRPMTADEQALSAVMKRVGPAYAVLVQALNATQITPEHPSSKVLKEAFTQTEAFWKSKGKADAIEWAHSAVTHVDAIDRAITSGKPGEAKAPTDALGQTCQTCHAAYRERIEDGTFRIRALAP